MNILRLAIFIMNILNIILDTILCIMSFCNNTDPIIRFIWGALAILWIAIFWESYKNPLKDFIKAIKEG